jgi:hypothetical protein
MSFRRIVPVLLGAAAIAAGAAGCGGDDGGTKGKFDASANASSFAGPTPLTVKFSAKSKNADGDVSYRWRFDDGTTSTEENATHSFPRAGYYLVVLDARDSSGANDRQSLLLGAWPPSQWDKAQRTPLTKQSALSAQRQQQQRTEQRRKDLRQKAREQIEQAAGGSAG